MAGIARKIAEGYTLLTYGDDYDADEGSIANGADHSVDFGVLNEVHSIEINNDESVSGRNLSVYLNGSSGRIFTVNAGESKTITGLRITRAVISNGSGSTINFRILMLGFRND